MNKRKISVSACIRFLLGLLLAVGCQTFFSPCVHEDGTFSTCHWAGVMLSGLGVVLAVLAFFAIVISLMGSAGRLQGFAASLSGGLQAGISLAMTVTAVFAALVPGGLIPLCLMNDMRCNAVMRPAAMLLSAAVALISLLDVFFLLRRKEG